MHELAISRDMNAHAQKLMAASRRFEVLMLPAERDKPRTLITPDGRRIPWKDDKQHIARPQLHKCPRKQRLGKSETQSLSPEHRIQNEVANPQLIGAAGHLIQLGVPRGARFGIKP